MKFLSQEEIEKLQIEEAHSDKKPKKTAEPVFRSRHRRSCCWWCGAWGLGFLPTATPTKRTKQI